MKKYLILPLLSLACVFFVPLVSAESSENVTKRRPDRTEQVQIQEIRQESKEKREEIKSKLEEMRSSVAENHANRLERRFKFYYNRLHNIIARFNQRLDNLDSQDPAVISIKSKLASATTKLEEAKSKGDSAVNAFRAIDPAKFSEQKSAARLAGEDAMLARKLFKEVHELLKDALKALKLITKPALPAASAATTQQ